MTQELSPSVSSAKEEGHGGKRSIDVDQVSIPILEECVQLANDSDNHWEAIDEACGAAWQDATRRTSAGSSKMTNSNGCRLHADGD